MTLQLQRFYDEMECMAVALDTVRGKLLTLSALTQRPTSDGSPPMCATLREQMGAVAESMTVAYESSWGGFEPTVVRLILARGAPSEGSVRPETRIMMGPRFA